MKLPLFVGFTILAAGAHAQTITPGSTGHGWPTFNCAVNDTYKDIDSGLVWQCGPTANTWKPTPQFQPWGSGGSLPSSNLGQIITNSNGSNTYAGQGQILYSQPGDTIASIEAACSSLCTYIVTTPQVVTLSANHTLSSNVQVDFKAGGQWTVNGAFTLTIPGNVTGTLNRHFAGTSTIAFGLLQQTANAEWFGVVNDGNLAANTGTDNTAAFNACIAALISGKCVVQAGQYLVASTITGFKNGVGLIGANEAWFVPNNATSTTIFSNNATSTVVSIAGTGTTGATAVLGASLENFNVARGVLPTGTATGVSVNYTYGARLNNITSNDSVRLYYIHASGSQGYGYIRDCTGQWGFMNLTETSGTYYGFYVDSADGIDSPSIRFYGDFVASNTSATPTTYGLYYNGTALNDLMAWNFETASLTYGDYFTNTGGGAFTSSDIHLYGPINDGFRQNGITFNNMTNAQYSAIEVNGGESTSVNSPAGAAVSISGSSGVSVIGHQMWGNAGFMVYVSGPNNRIVGNTLTQYTQHGIYFDAGSGGSIASNNNIIPSGSDGISAVNGASNLNISNNILGGAAPTGIFLSGTSTNIVGLDTNIFTGTFTTNVTSTKFMTSGCSISATTGGARAGTFTLGANSCTAVVTPNAMVGPPASNGWTCQAHDRTAPTILIGGESSSTTTTASFTIPAGAGATDVISFSCVPF